MSKSLFPAICILKAQGFQENMKLEKAKLDNDSKEVETRQYYIDSIDEAIKLLKEKHSKKE